MKKLAIIASFPVLIAAARFLPLNRLPSTCVFYHVTGSPCFTCGMTRATMALARLDFGRAMTFHPLAIVFVGAFAVLWAVASYEALTGRGTRILAWVRSRALMLTLSAFGMLLIHGVYRILMLMR